MENDSIETSGTEAPSRTSYISNGSSSQGTVFAEDTELKGSLSFTSRLEFNGRFEGELMAEAPLIIGETALIKGDVISSSSVTVLGKVKGNITAKDRVELKEKAHLYGDVRSPKLCIREGAIFVGRSDSLDGSNPSGDFDNLFDRLGNSNSSSGGNRSSKSE